MHTLTSYVPVKLASEVIHFMILRDLGNQPTVRRSLRENPKLEKRFNELIVILIFCYSNFNIK